MLILQLLILNNEQSVYMTLLEKCTYIVIWKNYDDFSIIQNLCNNQILEFTFYIYIIHAICIGNNVSLNSSIFIYYVLYYDF